MLRSHQWWLVGQKIDNRPLQKHATCSRNTVPRQHYAPGTLCPRNTMLSQHYAPRTLCSRDVRRVQDMLGTEVCTLITYLGHDFN